MKRKATFLLFQFVCLFSIGSAQITTIDSLNTFLTGKWIYLRCTGGISGFNCPSNPPPNRSTIFSKTSADSTFIKVYQNNSLIASREIQLNWNISSQIIDPVFGYRNPILGFYWSYNIVIADSMHIEFAEANCADCFVYSYRRDNAYAQNCANTFSVSDSIVHPLSCRGASDGSSKLIVHGGIAPYYYEWSNGAAAPIAFGLSNGIYSATVFDYNGCSASNIVAITAQFRCFIHQPIIQFPPIPLPGQH